MADQHAASLAFLAEFWEGQDISPEAIAAHRKENGRTWLEEVQAYLDGFEARDLSDEELRRCTEGSDLLFHLAVVFREAGMLSRISEILNDLTFYRGDGRSGNGYICDICGTAWVHHIAPGCQCPPTNALDELCEFWIDRAPRFGAVAAHFPESLRKRRFVASFWAPEVLLFGDCYALGMNRCSVDGMCSAQVAQAPPAGQLVEVPAGSWHAGHLVDTGLPAFWSPELPEVEVVKVASASNLRGKKILGSFDAGTGDGLRRLLAFLILLCLALPAGAQTLTGVVSRVSDGDTLVVGRVKVRLFGIDAPEGRQECVAPGGRSYRCGDTAKGFLARLAPPGAGISCVVRAVDRYGRLVGRCVVNGKDLSQWMVRAGWAVAYREYSVAYVPEEGAARAARRGMWAGSFVSPEEWRHAH